MTCTSCGKRRAHPDGGTRCMACVSESLMRHCAEDDVKSNRHQIDCEVKFHEMNWIQKGRIVRFAQSMNECVKGGVQL